MVIITSGLRLCSKFSLLGLLYNIRPFVSINYYKKVYADDTKHWSKIPKLKDSL